MLELRPNCEHCNRDLPPEHEDARICSFECTFCRDCVDNLLHGICPNCGGNFSPRPIRPPRLGRNDNDLLHYPARESRVHRPVDLPAHANYLKKRK
ncbi:DUF1272 domain-containing protein [Undibacterium fentianense]|uniref:DUF1272 domain-containing protein n=1 Tax=Undibacterium fentianense TaxID=2828728 RepID=A0A941IDX9_9BURK|nr:DUF1272 domain-containing protein [Undibacterium fentianense]MBR7799051.1 DUF1272 domain-containing protein [Undibacterium fentianense]